MNDKTQRQLALLLRVLPSGSVMTVWIKPTKIGCRGNVARGFEKQISDWSSTASTVLPTLHQQGGRAYSKEFFGVHNFKSSCMM